MYFDLFWIHLNDKLNQRNISRPNTFILCLSIIIKVIIYSGINIYAPPAVRLLLNLLLSRFYIEEFSSLYFANINDSNKENIVHHDFLPNFLIACKKRYDQFNKDRIEHPKWNKRI